MRYLWRHIRRSTGKSALAILLAALLFSTVGHFKLLAQSYLNVFVNTVVTARFSGGLQLIAARQIANSSYIADTYYESSKTVDINFLETELAITNDIARYTGESVDITYSDGYDTSCMDFPGEIIIVGNALVEIFGFKLGDTVFVTRQGLLDDLRHAYIAKYRGEHPGDAVTDSEILALYNEQIMAIANREAHICTVAGIVSTLSGKYDTMAFTPGSGEVSWIGTQAKLDMAEFTLADNLRAEEFREYCSRVNGGGATDSIVFSMDTSKLENPKNMLNLIETLYPVTIAMALLIGGVLCCLIILQLSKEAAIMRMLGMTRKKTCGILALEQTMLVIAGLILGIVGLLLYKGPELSLISGQLKLFASLYFAVMSVSAIICSVLATRRSVLEHLQTKE
jgi:hypothetical protein